MKQYKVAVILSSKIFGGHEFQSIELFKEICKYFDATLFVNHSLDVSLFKDKHLHYVKPELPLFKSGNFLSQFYYSVKYGKKIRELFNGYTHIIVCAGTVEAGISLGYILRNKVSFLYVPTYIDRIILWGRIGCLYNLLTGIFVYPYKKIITINRIQGKLFSKYKPIVVVPNRIFDEQELIQIESPTNRRLYFVGRIEAIKGLYTLINWLDTSQNPFQEFVIVGNGSEKPFLEKHVTQLKYLRVTFKGWLSYSEQEKEFSSRDIYITNSLFEGEPLAIREANRRGSVVIAKDIVGHKGCTHRKNRFRNKQELLHCLSLANANKLKVFENQSIQEIDVLREKAVRQLFL